MTTAEPPDEDVARLEQQARDILDSYRAFLASPAFGHQVDLAVLVKVAGDESAPARERLRAAEVLARLRLDAMAAVAELTGVREQSLDRLGIKTGGPSVALTQVNNRIEIVRASDWRSAPPLEQGAVVDVEVLPDGDESAALPLRQDPASGEASDAADPPP